MVGTDTEESLFNVLNRIEGDKALLLEKAGRQLKISKNAKTHIKCLHFL